MAKTIYTQAEQKMIRRIAKATLKEMRKNVTAWDMYGPLMPGPDGTRLDEAAAARVKELMKKAINAA